MSRTDLTWEEVAQLALKEMPAEAKALREEALEDLWVFAQLVNPFYMYGDIHKEAYRWLQEHSLHGKSDDQTANKLLLLPRAHLKSHVVATTCAWLLAKYPTISTLYVSATAALAEAQLYDIQTILLSPQFTKYFPEYVHPIESKRARWNMSQIRLDHPEAKASGVRDPSVATAGLTTNTTGWHADIILADDLVVPENAYTEEGRETVKKKASQFTSIRNNGGFTIAAGTRYHPNDIYSTWKEQKYEVYDDEGELVEKKPTWDILSYAVETEGRFLWPRTYTDEGKGYGFDLNTLSRIRSEYEDVVQYYAQYYNDPNDPGSNRISRDKFQYIDPKFITYSEGQWLARGRPLRLYAAMDFAYTTKKTSDFTSIVVIGIDSSGYIYVLDIERFKTDRVSEMYKRLKTLHDKWTFMRLRAECTAAQIMIVNDLKDKIREDGGTLVIEEYRPMRSEGSKEERIRSTLEPRYENRTIFHIKGGHTHALEEELIVARPKHDDIKDALASAVSIAKPPANRKKKLDEGNVVYSKRFGGVKFSGRYK